MKKVLISLAIILAMATILQAMPMSAFAALVEEFNKPEFYEPDATEFVSDSEEEPAEDSYIMFEDEKKRELSSKQFRMSDGSFMAVSYPEQVHFIDNDGNFTDIDNRLIYSETKEENDFSGYSNKANSFNIKFNETLFAENAVIYRLAKGDRTFSLERIQGENSYISNANADATITQAKDDADPFEKEGDAAGELAFVSSKISYSNEENKVDFDYVLIGNHINEYIVIKEKLDNYTFTYRISAEGLTAAKDENGGIVFTDDSGEIIYSIPAPFMYDSNGVYSDAVDYELTEADGAYILTVQTDEGWINEEDRTFPVTIDPDLYVGEYNVENPLIEDADVWQGSPTAHSGGYEYMTVGYSNFDNEQEMRALVKLNNLPEIPNAAIIVDARLNLKQLVQFLHPENHINDPVFDGNTPIDFAARMILSSWSESSVTWNTKPSVNTTILDYRTATPNTAGYYLAFDITEAASKWYNGTASNYGIEISTLEDLSGYHYARFVTSENPNQYSNVLPMFKLSYRDNKGIEDYWTFHSINAADAGTIYINDFTGNPVAITEIFSTPGNILPISVGLVYNGYIAGYRFSSDNADDAANGKYNEINYSYNPLAITADFSNMKIGKGFKLNVQETVVSQSVGSRTYYVHSDSDGTEHYYYNFDGGSTFYSEDGLGWKITLSGSNKILSDEKGNKKTFNNSGYLTKVEDANGNSQTYTYSSSYTGRLTSITSKPVGSSSSQSVSFSYNSAGYLTSINYNSDVYSFTYSNNRISKVSRGIYENGGLNNGGHVSFSYSSNKLTCLYSESTGIRAKITYNDDNKAATIYQTVNTYIGQKTGFEYSDEKKTIIRTTGKDDKFETADDIFSTYVFDNYGRTITSYTKDLSDKIASASNAAYTTATGKSKAVNGISKSGSAGAPSVNLIKESSYEAVTGNWSYSKASTHTIARTTDYSFIGNKSLKFTASGSGTSYYNQGVVLNAGKTYTLSAYVKTDSLVGSGAFVYLDGQSSMKLTGTTDTSIQNGWQRIYCTYTPDTTATYYPSVRFSASSGSAYFDAVQVEEGDLGAYNLVDNGSFIYGSSLWTLSTGASVNQTDHTLTTQGNHAGNVTATQTINLNMPVNTTYMLSAWATGDSADINVSAHIINNNNYVDYYQKSRTFQVKATIYYYTSSGSLSSTTTVGYAKFNPDTNQLQYSITPVVPNTASVGTLSKQAYVKIEISYNNNVNKADFSNISFTAEPAQTYTYDPQGNLSDVQSADGNKPAYTFAADSSDLTNITNSDGSGYTVKYDSKHQPTKITDANNVKAEYTYDAKGNVTQVEVKPSSGTDSILTQTTYKDSGRFVETVTNERGKVTTYDYNTANGLLNYVKDANNNQTQYKYNIYKAITDVFADLDKDGTADSNEAKVSYVYDSNRNISQIVTRTSTYNLSYDHFGNVSSITVGSSSTPLVSYTYANYNGKLTKTTYANGTYVQNVYDALDRTTGIKYNGTVRYSVKYDKSGSVSSIYDNENNIEYLYEYDRLGRLVRYYEAENGTIRTVSAEQFDNIGRTNKVTYKNDGYTAKNTSYNYDSTGRISSMTLPGGDMEFLSYDTFGRQNFRRYYRNSNYTLSVTNGYEDVVISGNDHTSSNINNVTYNFRQNNTSLSYNYLFDNIGNISSVSVNNDSLALYQYDSLNQLKLERNYDTEEIYRYYYDNGGNITSVTARPISGGTEVTTGTYVYGNSNWQDQLTSYNGHTITYDNLGNPLSYYNGSSYTFTWKDGRKLATLTKGSTSVSYKYNSDGIRYEKTVNGVVHKYYLMGSTITAETIIDSNTTTKIEYFYDTYGAYGFSIGSDFYYYVKNLQGDVTQIRDVNNNLIASYVYDAWGKVLSVTENNSNNIGAKNAIRYRGYYYDTESNLYYLNARYYDPQIKRFISADGTLGANSDMFGYNLYAYCGNNPVVRVDYNGEWWIPIAAIVIAAVVVVCSVTLTSCSKSKTSKYGAASSYRASTSKDFNCYAYALGETKWKYVGGSENAIKNYDVYEVAKIVLSDAERDGRKIRPIYSYDSEIESNEYRIALRTGKDDYHFMIQHSDGSWSHKPSLCPTRPMKGANPSVASWDQPIVDSYLLRFGIVKETGSIKNYYDSDTLYFAVTKQ